MGDVISISRVSDVDIFSRFDAQCPQIPAEIDNRIPNSARKAVVKSTQSDEHYHFRNHCIVVVVLSFVVLAGVKYVANIMAQSSAADGAITERGDTSYRDKQASWLEQIKLMELDPAYQRVLEEKRLYARSHSR